MVKSKLIINACITGMVPTKGLNPNTPITPNEIIRSALNCAKFGASIVHIHPRDRKGLPTWKKEVFAKIIYGIREQNPDLIVSVTTSGRLWDDLKKRSACLELESDLKPDLASLTVGSLNFINTESVNSPSVIEALANKMGEKGIKPELEVFEPGMVHKAKYLINKGVISKTRPYFNILLGSLGTSPLEPSSFAAFYNILPKDSVWSIAGIGVYQLDANLLGLALGGHVRVGLEDNLYYDRGKTMLTSNEELIQRFVQICNLSDRKVATPKEARKILSLK